MKLYINTAEIAIGNIQYPIIHIVCKYFNLAPSKIPLTVTKKLPAKLIENNVTNTELLALSENEITLYSMKSIKY